MLASIVIRAYNAELTFARAVESALSQDFPKDAYEVIIVDDGSTDDTPQIVDSFSDRCRVIHQQNQGAAKAANRGFGSARGEYVSLLDADDELRPDFLKEMTHVLDADHTLALALCDYEEERDKVRKTIQSTDPFQAIAGSMCYRYVDLKNAGWYAAVTVFPEYEIMLRMQGIWRFVRVPQALYVYHRSMESITGSKSRVERGITELTRLHPDKADSIRRIRAYTLP
jgi:glycosyltransferase involved in cell wall biosynthesis